MAKNLSKCIAIIPARGGSKGIPRKNLRIFNGKPLLYYSIETAKKSSEVQEVYVSTEDKEIANYCLRQGVNVIKRENNLANDDITLDSVISSALKKINKLISNSIVITLQPTSPNLTQKSLDEAIKLFKQKPKVNTIISSVEKKHIFWYLKEGKLKSFYKERLNRQCMEPVFFETGGFVISRFYSIQNFKRINQPIELFNLNEKESIDIDSFIDWRLAEIHSQSNEILINTIGNNKIGLGHVYNMLSIANRFPGYDISFVFSRGNELGDSLVKSYNYNSYLVEKEELTEFIIKKTPLLLINDCLDTSKNFMNKINNSQIKVVNFEDRTENNLADLTFNAIYQGQISKNKFYGHKYYILREEFSELKPIKIKGSVENIILTFGGSDPNNYTEKVATAMLECDFYIGKITIILGKGYNYRKPSWFENLSQRIVCVKHTSMISNYMSSADIAISSAGRTIYELSHLGIPSLIYYQNKREEQHFFADNSNGFLISGSKFSKKILNSNLKKVIKNHALRKKMNKKMQKNDLSKGINRVENLIKKLLK